MTNCRSTAEQQKVVMERSSVIRRTPSSNGVRISASLHPGTRKRCKNYNVNGKKVCEKGDSLGLGPGGQKREFAGIG